MILVIGKPAQFNEDHFPVRGQCQPQSPGWQLRAFEKGEEIFLYKSTYYVCRQLQLRCRGLSIEEARRAISEFETTVMDDMEETACLTADRSNEKTVVLSEIETRVGDAPSDSDPDIDDPAYSPPPPPRKRTKSFDR